MMIHEITGKVGKHKARKRVGRGRGSGVGKTSGRGHKGAGSRAGFKRRAYFEGGQMSFVRRLPKRGFTNVQFRDDYHIVNIKTLEARFEDGATVDTAALIEAGVVRDAKQPLKILGEGELTKKLAVSAHKFSAGAKAKIEEAGGSTTILERPKWSRETGAKNPKRTPKPRAKGAPKG